MSKTATKTEEIAALGKIIQIVKELGPDSYLAAAFDGCFEIAADNIRNDFVCGMKQRMLEVISEAKKYKRSSENLAQKLSEAEKSVAQLTSALEKEQEWIPYEFQENVSQSEYDHLVNSGADLLDEEKAKSLIANWFGFSMEKIRIIDTLPRYQINRHNQLRVTGTRKRSPAYFASDWNYIRFDCADMAYELYNGELRFFFH